jgi:hypothetical protein
VGTTERESGEGARYASKGSLGGGRWAGGVGSEEEEGNESEARAHDKEVREEGGEGDNKRGESGPCIEVEVPSAPLC